MAEISAVAVKELREQTGAGMMDCKKALAEAGGDMAKAVDWLRAKGLAAAAKKAGRVAAEGLVAVSAQGTSGVVVEVNSETDFVSRNDKFQAFVRAIADLARAKGAGLEALKKLPYPGTGRSVEEEAVNLVATIGENIQIRRVEGLSVARGIVASYLHNSLAPGLGKIGVLVGIESPADPAKLAELGKQIAMHVAAAKPLAATVEGLDPAAVERERKVLSEQAAQSGKPADIVAKMVEGRLRKYYEEVVLDRQIFVIDSESKVGDVVAKAAKELGHPVKIAGFVRFTLGEGIEKQATDFAAEVLATAGLK
ncbi:MAG: elongation factor Ts [Alphaproteobacteria bacterium]|nr:elongation factor Ts [Alphaproteobacteria bacterium]